MWRWPESSAAATASRVSSAGVWKTPRPRAGISTPLFSVRAGVIVGCPLLRVWVWGPLARGRRRRPAGEQAQGLLRGRADLGRVERHPQSVVGIDRERLVAELDL